MWFRKANFPKNTKSALQIRILCTIWPAKGCFSTKVLFWSPSCPLRVDTFPATVAYVGASGSDPRGEPFPLSGKSWGHPCSRLGTTGRLNSYLGDCTCHAILCFIVAVTQHHLTKRKQIKERYGFANKECTFRHPLLLLSRQRSLL